MKRSLLIILALILVFSVALVGCNNTTPPNGNEGGTNEGGSNEGGNTEGGADEGGSTEEEKAELVIETLISSETVMGVLDDEAEKVDNSQNSNVKNYIDNLSDSDKSALRDAISKMNSEDPKKQTLSKLFGN